MAICKTVACRAKSAPSTLDACTGPGPAHKTPAAALAHTLALRTLSDYVDAIQVATVTRSKAHRITVAAHTNNLAVVTTTWKQMAKTYCIKLQKFGLTSSIAPGDGGGDDGGSDGPETQ